MKNTNESLIMHDLCGFNDNKYEQPIGTGYLKAKAPSTMTSYGAKVSLKTVWRWQKKETLEKNKVFCGGIVPNLTLIEKRCK